ncbi:MAG: iron-sulfur cluster assembly scaffold protein [Thermoflexales bacterium]|nr:iron-sulfur cluster assembly scaffold protein [Thermoflexales bacterium]
MPTPYRKRILDHYQHPRHRGHLTAPDRVGEAENPLCGDRVRVELRLNGTGTVAEATFTGEGCVIALAAASMLMEHIQGQPLEELRQLGDADVVRWLGMDLRPARQACARVALEALRNAIRNYSRKQEVGSRK